MDQAFNMGVVLVVLPHFADSIRRQVEDCGYDCWPLGQECPGQKSSQLGVSCGECADILLEPCSHPMGQTVTAGSFHFSTAPGCGYSE